MIIYGECAMRYELCLNWCGISDSQQRAYVSSSTKDADQHFPKFIVFDSFPLAITIRCYIY